MLRFTLAIRQSFFSTFHVTFNKIINVDKNFGKRWKRLSHLWTHSRATIHRPNVTRLLPGQADRQTRIHRTDYST